MTVRTIEEVEQELTTIAGHLNAVNYRFLMVLAEFDALQGYAGVGVASCAHWVSWRCGVGLQAAREKVRVARALQQLPLLSDAMRRGGARILCGSRIDACRDCRQ